MEVLGSSSSTGLLLMPAFYLIAAGLVGLVAVRYLSESKAQPLPGSGPAAGTDSEARELANTPR